MREQILDLRSGRWRESPLFDARDRAALALVEELTLLEGRVREACGSPAGDRPRRVGARAGLTDVHRYLVIVLEGRRVTVDVTFPGAPPWDGRSSMPLACGPGVDHVSHGDPDRHKRRLERLHCDAATREAFIAALAA